MCKASFNFNLNGVEVELIISKQCLVLSALQVSLLTRCGKMWDVLSISKCSLILVDKLAGCLNNVTGVTVWKNKLINNKDFRLWNWIFHVNPIQDGGGGGQKGPPPYQFFPCNFYKRRNQPPKLVYF